MSIATANIVSLVCIGVSVVAAIISLVGIAKDPHPENWVEREWWF